MATTAGNGRSRSGTDILHIAQRRCERRRWRVQRFLMQHADQNFTHLAWVNWHAKLFALLYDYLALSPRRILKLFTLYDRLLALRVQKIRIREV